MFYVKNIKEKYMYFSENEFCEKINEAECG